MSNQRRFKWQGKGKKKKEAVSQCYNCKKPRNLIADSPNLKASTSRRIPKKKVMMASWDDDSESDFGDDIDMPIFALYPIRMTPLW